VDHSVVTNERWGELILSNQGSREETVTVIVRHYEGEPFLSETHILAPGEKRTIRIEDRKWHIDVADKMLENIWPPLPKADSTVLVEPAPKTVSVVLRQMDLAGDQLTTYDLAPARVELRKNFYVRINPLSPIVMLSNIGNKPERVVLCRGTDFYSCSPEQIVVPAFSNMLLPKRNMWQPREPSFVYIKNKEVIFCQYSPVKGSTSTFDVNSDITFGPVTKKSH
jgi:hypothetical protein